jgi:hypothetical protein
MDRGRASSECWNTMARPEVPIVLAESHIVDGIKLRPDDRTTANEMEGSAAAHTRQRQKDRAWPRRASRPHISQHSSRR